MSIIKCERCEKIVDSDYNQIGLGIFDGKEYCEDCVEQDKLDYVEQMLDMTPNPFE